MGQTEGKTGESITLIVMQPAGFDSTEEADRKGGETHAVKHFKDWVAQKVSVDPDELRKNLEDAMERVGVMLAKLERDVVKGWALDSISVGLALSAEGSVGIATVGAETSIELGFAKAGEPKQ